MNFKMLISRASLLTAITLTGAAARAGVDPFALIGKVGHHLDTTRFDRGRGR